ncbi:MAG: bacillithiol system redox-active protein YtxJ [Sphingobacteriales bacterium]|mgnify:CR=1 FL=1|nr:bacillithiol system redox-active protein YtxJ [Sphingobacteriales bacterium]OJY91779.1 MAG: thioredoxin family protein [Sphingobacteriales bacterium 44-15]
MEWKKLTSEVQWSEILERSYQKPQVIYKHSPRCSISSVVKSRLERSNMGSDIDFYFLDVIADRGLSRAIAEDMRVVHESPQVLLIRDGSCVYNESHSAIMMDEIVEKSST